MGNWIDYLLTIVSGLAVTIPLVIKLVEYVQKAIKEKNWDKLLNLILVLMKEAEEQFATGAERKEWVMSMVETSSEHINYDIDMDEVSKLIDSLCEMSKVVNGTKEGESVGH